MWLKILFLFCHLSFVGNRTKIISTLTKYFICLVNCSVICTVCWYLYNNKNNIFFTSTQNNILYKYIVLHTNTCTIEILLDLLFLYLKVFRLREYSLAVVFNGKKMLTKMNANVYSIVGLKSV